MNFYCSDTGECFWRSFVVDKYQEQMVCPCSTDEYIYPVGILYLNFSILDKSIVSNALGLELSSFEPTSVLYISPTDNDSMQELVMQDDKQKLYKTCAHCRKDTQHIESKHILQPPEYLIIVNRFNYMNNSVTKKRSLIPLDLTIMLGPHKFNLQAT